MSKKKKIIFTVILTVLVILISSGIYVADLFLGYHPPEIKKISESNVENYNEIKLTAHRGFSGIAPENTVAAFEKAGEYGFYASECDVHLTKDGVWVIYHDDNIFRLTNGYKNIADVTYEELNEYVIDNGVYVENYPTQKIPTLEEYLVVCKDLEIAPQIEIKNGSEEKLSEIVDMLEKYDLKEKAMVISFKSEMLLRVKHIDDSIELWYLTEEITDEAISLCRENDFALAFNSDENDDFVIKSATDCGIKLCAWTVDELDEVERLYNLGIRFITTNSIIPEK